MTERFWTVDEANAALPRVTALVEQARAAAHAARTPANGRRRVSSNGHRGAAPAVEELSDAIDELDRDGIVLRDLDRGLVDFPARSASGRHYWLCWVLGEPAVEWWHWPEDGFAGRTPLSDPPA
jgi:hypothetical protein